MKFNKHYKVYKGFTLLEVSIALAIVAFLSYTITLGVKATHDFDRYAENKQLLDNVRTSLLMFAQSNGYLPCPDSDATPDGVENRTGNVCNDKNGFLPYQMLGVDSNDAWDQPLHYTINERADVSGVQQIDLPAESASFFNNTAAPVFNTLTKPVGLTSGAGNISVCGEDVITSCTSSTADADVIELKAIAIVVSFGKNGTDTWAKVASGSTAVALLDAAEEENADDDNYFWQASGSNVSGQEFDDQMVWITGYDVKYALLRSDRGLK